ncbi:MAG: zinc ribbon domain-containing protein [Nitrospirota bacterium]
MYCSKCGKENQDTTNFCSTCGTRLVDDSLTKSVLKCGCKLEKNITIWWIRILYSFLILLIPVFIGFMLIDIVGSPILLHRKDKEREAVARENLGSIRRAISIYYEDNRGQWPVKLDETLYSYTVNGELFPPFIPNYMMQIPNATLRRSISHNNKKDIIYTTTGPNEFIPRDKITDKGGWIYSSNSGDCRINCSHKDTAGLEYYKYGHEEP